MGRFIIHLFLTTFFTMLMIYLIKAAANKYNIPFVKTIANNV